MATSARHIIYFTLLVAVLSGTATLGFKEGAYRENVYGEPTPNPVQVETTAGFVKLTINLSKTIYRVGEPINITVKLTNIGNTTVWLGSPPTLDFIVYKIVYNKSLPPSFPPTLQPIYAYSWEGFVAVAISFRIEPDESFSMTSAWAQLGRYGSGSQSIYKQVDPGFYLIAGKTVFGVETYDDVEVSEVETPKILVDIMPEEGIVVEATKFPLKLATILEKITFEVGEIVNFTFLLVNIGNETLPLSLYGDVFGFVIYDEIGFEVYASSKNMLYPAVYIPDPLPPGSSRSGGLSWYQNYNPKLVTLEPHALFDYRKVSSGRYKVVGQFFRGLSHSVVETPPVTITIGYETKNIEAIPRQ